jgi:hypothetical protein
VMLKIVYVRKFHALVSGMLYNAFCINVLALVIGHSRSFGSEGRVYGMLW